MIGTRVHLPAAAALTEIGSELPVFDADVFAQTEAVVAPQAFAAYLSEAAAQAEAVLVRLSGKAAPEHRAAEFARDAHALAGRAGLFGLSRLAAISAALEYAIQADAPQAGVLAERLGRTIEASLPHLHRRLREVGEGRSMASRFYQGT